MSQRTANLPTLLLVLAVAFAPTHGAGGQRASLARLGVTHSERADTHSSLAAYHPSHPDSATTRLDRVPLWVAPLASAVVPGLGQIRLHNDRFVGYMAAEAYLVLQFLKSTRERDAESDTYRQVARNIARRSFVVAPGATPPDTLWKYYEGLRNYLESGFFTLSPVGSTQPETDTTTFNGHQWLVARQQNGIGLNDPGASSSPSYPAALAYYELSAVRQQYRWSWRNAQLEWDVYKRTTERANNAQRQATNDLIALIANHIISTIDAFASVRLIQAAGGGMHISASIPTP